MLRGSWICGGRRCARRTTIGTTRPRLPSSSATALFRAPSVLDTSRSDCAGWRRSISRRDRTPIPAQPLPTTSAAAPTELVGGIILLARDDRKDAPIEKPQPSGRTVLLREASDNMTLIVHDQEALNVALQPDTIART